MVQERPCFFDDFNFQQLRCQIKNAIADMDYRLKSGIFWQITGVWASGSTTRENLPTIFLWSVGGYSCVSTYESLMLCVDLM